MSPETGAIPPSLRLEKDIKLNKKSSNGARPPPPSHSRRALQSQIAPSAPCFGQFRFEKTILNCFFSLPSLRLEKDIKMNRKSSNGARPPPPSHSHRALQSQIAPSAPCFGRFRFEKTIRNCFFSLPSLRLEKDIKLNRKGSNGARPPPPSHRMLEGSLFRRFAPYARAMG